MLETGMFWKTIQRKQAFKKNSLIYFFLKQEIITRWRNTKEKNVAGINIKKERNIKIQYTESGATK